MGLLYESDWICYVLISTGSLKYKVGEFKIHCTDDGGNLPTEEGGTETTHADIQSL